MDRRQRRGWYRIANVTEGAPARVDIYDEIGDDPWGGGVSAQAFIADLAKVNGDLEVHINSPGGSVFDGLAIYNAIMQRPGNVTTVVDGLAASAASFIAQAGRTRIIAPGAMVMIHDAQGLCIGNEADMTETAALLAKASGNIADLYAASSGRPAFEWRQAMQSETWYTAQEAVEAGLADRVAERPAPAQTAAVAAQWAREMRAEAWKLLGGAAADEGSWDGSAAMSAAAGSENPAAAYAAICAGRRDGDPGKQSSWALPHHEHPGAPPNRAGVNNAAARLPQTQGLTNKDAAEAHLKAHQSAMGDGGDTDDRAELPAWLTALTAKEAARR